MTFSLAQFIDAVIAFGAQHPVVAACYTIGICDVVTFIAFRAIIRTMR